MEDAQKNNANSAKPQRERRKKAVLIAAGVIVLVALIGAVAMNQMSKNSAFCGSCHIIKPYYESWKSGELLANKHAAAGVKCLDCHHKSYLEKAQEGLRYVTGSYSKPLKEITFTREQCLKCHGKDFSKVVAATSYKESNPHDSHLGEMDCTLCHKMHKKSKVYCAQCHEFSWFNELDSSWEAGVGQS
ncbi:MAG: cytochrome c3 family protein [Thermacetogeniaceae bacterium]